MCHGDARNEATLLTHSRGYKSRARRRRVRRRRRWGCSFNLGDDVRHDVHHAFTLEGIKRKLHLTLHERKERVIDTRTDVDAFLRGLDARRR